MGSHCTRVRGDVTNFVRANVKRGRAALLAATALGGAFAPAIANAQTDSPGAATAEMSEIIVTARKRQESLLNVPVIETVLTAARIDRTQTVELKDIAKLTPGLAVADGVLAIGAQISLRGVGTSTLDPGVDQSISLNIDGLSLSQGLAFQSGTFDLGQVEVLKGPQALFYGKSSPGGVISLRTADPTDRFELIARAGYEFEASTRRGELIVSGPVTDTLKVRLAGMYSKSDGFFENDTAYAADLSTGAQNTKGFRVSPSKNYMIRATVLWKPSDLIDVRAKANLVNDKILYAGIPQLVSCPSGIMPYPGVPAFGIPSIQFVNPSEDCRQDHHLSTVDLNPAFFPGLSHNGVQYNYSTQKYGSVEINLHPTNALTLTSTTAYYDLRFDGAFNISDSSLAAPIYGYENNYRRHDFTQEIRLNSDWSGPFNFTVGAYYQDGSVSNVVSLIANRAYTIGGSVPLVTDFISRPAFDIKSESVFGQLRYKPTEKLEIAAGGRYTHEVRNSDAAFIFGGVRVPVTLPVPKIKSGNFSPELTISYKPNQDLTLFGSAKKGYKSGSFNLSPVTGADQAFGDEKVEGGELGLKSRLLDRRLSLNLAGYYYEYSGLQVGVSKVFAAGQPPVSATVNAGKARVYGVDFDSTYSPPQIEGLTLRAGVAWNRARFVDLHGVPCWFGQIQSEGCNETLNPATGFFTAQGLDGAPLVRAPNWQGTFGFSYDVPVGDMTLTLNNDNQFSTRFLANLGRREDFYQKGFVKVDLSATLRGRDDRWEVAVIGKNVANILRSNSCPASKNTFGLLGIPGVDDFTGAAVRGPYGVSEVGCIMDQGRSVWVRLTLRPFN